MINSSRTLLGRLRGPLWAVLLSVVGHAGAARAEAYPIFRNQGGRQFVFLQPTQPAPPAAVTRLDGTVAYPADWRGKTVVLSFWASWCAPCLAELPALDRLAARSDPGAVAVVAISVDDLSAQGVKDLAARGNLTSVQMMRDPDQRLGSLSRQGVARGALPIYGLPTTYVLTPAGEVAGYIVGPSDWTSPAATKLLAFLSQL